MVAAMTLKFLDPFGSGKLVLFQVTYDKVCVNRWPQYSCASYPIFVGLACIRVDLLPLSWCLRGTSEHFRNDEYA